MAKISKDLGVRWYLPGKKRHFMSTTKAESDLIELLAGDGYTWRQMYDAINYGEAEKAVCTAFIDAGYGDRLVSDFVREV